MDVVTVNAIEFSDQTRIITPHAGIVIFVGPNNAGKSQALKDIRGNLASREYKGPTLSCTYSDFGAEQFTAWAAENIPRARRNDSTMYTIPGWGEQDLYLLASQWTQSRGQGLGPFTDLFVLHADGNSRLTAGDSQPSIDLNHESPIHPVQRAYSTPALESAIDSACKDGFGLGVTVDRYGGSTISLRVGDRPTFNHQEGVPTDNYLKELKHLTKLEDQGDGVRSYVGLLLHILGGAHSVLLIDEPEAFLHPPQARQLGRVLTEQSGSQLFISTHSSDVVQGSLESGAPVTIVRITREGDVNHAAVLDDQHVAKLWSDPILRYSNVLDGLFNDVVVICEGDADCRYYSAVLDHLEETGATTSGPQRRPQVLFTHSGGKSRLPSLAKALRAVKVPVITIADFDILRNEDELRRTIESLGGNFGDYQPDVRILNGALQSTPRSISRIALREALIEAIDSQTEANIDQREAESLRRHLKVESGWDRVKSGGLHAVPQGQAYDAAGRLLDALEELGLLVVPIGELERFAPSVSGHGPAWVTGVLDQKLHTSPGPDAQAFIEKLRAAAYAAARLDPASRVVSS